MSNPSPERKALIQRIAKLRAMTIANGCSEGEANSAMALITKLMDAYGITESEASVREDVSSCSLTHFRAMAGQANGMEEWTKLIAPIGKLFNCKSYSSDDLLDELGLGFTQRYINANFFGTPQDQEAAFSLMSILYTALMTECSTFLNILSQAKPKVPATKRPHMALSFRLGMIMRLKDRLVALRNERLVPSTNTGLMVLKDQLVNDEFARYCRANNIRLSKIKYHSITADPRAYTAGQVAGSRVDLGQSGRLASSPRPSPSLKALS